MRIVAVAVVASAVVSGAVAARSALKPEAGSFAGSAGAGFPVKFTVSGNGREISGLRTDFEGTVNCGPPATNPPYFDFPALTITDGSFHGETDVVYRSGISPHYTIKGTFSSAAHADGTIRVTFSYPHNALPPCDETDKFSAAHER